MINFDITQIGKATMILFAVVDIVGSIPMVIEIKRRAGGVIYPFRATMVSLGIMIGVLFLGESILEVLGVHIQEFAVAGSFVLFFMSLEMILGIKLFRDEEVSKTAYIVPLAFPLIAGAGTMTSILSIRAEFETVNIISAIIINCAVIYLVLISVGRLEKVLGVGGIAVMRKVFGIILMAMAVKLFSANAAALFHVAA
jgi:multiple antibiotic resistance protein